MLINPFIVGYRANAVFFDGTNDWLTRGAGLTGAADGKLFAFSCWFRAETGSDASATRIITGNTTLGGGTATQRLRLSKSASNLFNVIGVNSAGTEILNILSTADSIKVATGWVHILCSCDMSDTAKRFIYLNDVSDLATITTYANDTLDMTENEWAVGGSPDGATKAACDMADLMFWPTYVDFSVTANRRLFIDAAHKPVNPSGAVATLGTPLVFLQGPAANFNTNLGGGGNFTVHGTLTEAATSPSG